MAKYAGQGDTALTLAEECAEVIQIITKLKRFNGGPAPLGAPRLPFHLPPTPSQDVFRRMVEEVMHRVAAVRRVEDEDRAVHCVNYCKILWYQSIPELKARWPTYRGKDPWIQPYNNFRMESGSWCLGIVGNPGKIRSQHPTIVVSDEACYITRGEESFNVAQATPCHHIVCLSSANPSWFRERTEFASPTNWPDYRSVLAA